MLMTRCNSLPQKLGRSFLRELLPRRAFTACHYPKYKTVPTAEIPLLPAPVPCTIWSAMRIGRDTKLRTLTA